MFLMLQTHKQRENKCVATRPRVISIKEMTALSKQKLLSLITATIGLMLAAELTGKSTIYTHGYMLMKHTYSMTSMRTEIFTIKRNIEIHILVYTF